MKKSVKLLCLVLALLLVASMLIGAFASIAYGAESQPANSANSAADSSETESEASAHSSSDSSSTTEAKSSTSATTSASTSGGTSGGSGSASGGGAITKGSDDFMWHTYPLFSNEGSLSYTTRLTKNKRYEVTLEFVDMGVTRDEMHETASDASLTAFVEASGGNFVVVPAPRDRGNDEEDLGCSIGLTGFTESDHPIYVLSFYVRPDGTGKQLSFNLVYEYKGYGKDSKPDEWVTRTGSLSRTIPDMRIDSGSGESDSSSESSEDETYKVGTPNIIITSYNYGGGQIVAGSEFPLTIKFKNTSPEVKLENIIMDVTTSANLAIASGSNSSFIEKLSIGQSAERSLQVSAAVAAKPEPQQVTVKFSFEYVLNKKREKGERTEVIAIPIVQPNRFSVGELVVPGQIFPGDSAYLSVEYVNKGKTDVYNVAARLETNVPGVGESQIIGNVTPGSSGTIDFSVSVNDPGTITGKVIITYEDEKGEEQAEELPFTATVMEMGGMGMDDPTINFPMEPPPPEGLSTPAIVMACVGGTMVAGLVFTLVVKKAKRKREEGDDEDI